MACLALAAPGPAVAAQTAEERLTLLETKLDALTERVAALETTGASVATDSDEAGIAWRLDAALSGKPLRVSHKLFDVDRGQIELLLEVTETLPNAHDWQAGRLAPVVVTLRGPDGDEQSLPMTLLRGDKLEPGGSLHLSLLLDPARAAATTQLKIQQLPTP